MFEMWLDLNRLFMEEKRDPVVHYCALNKLKKKVTLCSTAHYFEQSGKADYIVQHSTLSKLVKKFTQSKIVQNGFLQLGCTSSFIQLGSV